MILLQLLDKQQSNDLYDLTEIHMAWFLRKCGESPLFEVLIELNVNKLEFALTQIKKKNGEVTLDDVTAEILKLKNNYLYLLDIS